MDIKPQKPRRGGGIRAQNYEDNAKMEITVQFCNQVGEMKCPDRVLVRSASLGGFATVEYFIMEKWPASDASSFFCFSSPA